MTTANVSKTVVVRRGNVFWAFLASTSSVKWFMRVKDMRFLYDPAASFSINQAANSSCNDNLESGFYFGLYTGYSGAGRRVDTTTLLVFLRRFGATDEQLMALNLI